MADANDADTGFFRRPALPLDALRRRYDALGPIEDWPGERTLASRCATFERLLENGALCAELLREELRSRERIGLDPADALAVHPALCRLMLEAWP